MVCEYRCNSTRALRFIWTTDCPLCKFKRSVVTASQSLIENAPIISRATSIMPGSTHPTLNRYSDSTIRAVTYAMRGDRTSPNVLSERSYRRLLVVGMNDRKGWLTVGRVVIELQVPGTRQRNNPVDLTVVSGYGLPLERQKGRVERSSTNRAGDLRNYIL